MWTLTSLAIRIAQAIGLHSESSLSPLRPFEREMRRRLWWQICALDSHASEDRASNPLIVSSSFDTKLPLHINDEDMEFDMDDEPNEQDCFTEISFCLLCHEQFDTVRQLNFVPMKEVNPSIDRAQEEWGHRIEKVVNLQHHIEKRYLRHLNLARPFQWTTRIVADLNSATMWLSIYRPLERRPNRSLPSPIPDILCLAVNVLERSHSLNTDPAASAFRWLSLTYVQWHALAVASAELCVRTQGTIVKRAWGILEAVLGNIAQHVADSHKGMLWRPIKKLMKKARVERQNYLDSLTIGGQLSAPVAALDVSEPSAAASPLKQPTPSVDAHTADSMGATMHPVQDYQQLSYMSNSDQFDWDPWLAAAVATTAPQNQLSSDIDQMAWTSWEDFVMDFHRQDEALLGPSL